MPTPKKPFYIFMMEAQRAIERDPSMDAIDFAVRSSYWGHLSPSRTEKKSGKLKRMRIDTCHPSVGTIAGYHNLSKAKVAQVVSKAIELGDFVQVGKTGRLRHFAFRHFRYYYYPIDDVSPEDMATENMETWYERRGMYEIDYSCRHLTLPSGKGEWA